MHKDDTFATALNCIDGRTQEPVTKWVKEQFNVKYVDTITEPGMDNLTNDGSGLHEETVQKKALFSIEKHLSCGIVICGHHDCAGNPISKEEHIEEIKEFCRKVLSKWQLGIPVFGLFVNEDWNIEVVYSEK